MVKLRILPVEEIPDAIQSDFDSFSLLSEISGLFTPPLSQRVNLNEYWDKVTTKGHVIIAFADEVPVGMAGFYANDAIKRAAFLTFIAILPKHRGLGAAKAMLQYIEDFSRDKGMKYIDLEVFRNNIPAVSMYKSLGFVFFPDDPEKDHPIMRKTIGR